MLQKLKSHFVTLKAFLRMGCDAEIKGTRVVLANNSISIVVSPQSSVVRYLTLPQFSSFFGLGNEKCKGIAYQVWRFEVESVNQGNLLSYEVIAAPIRKSLQGEVKTKIIGFGPKMSVERILGQLDQFYGDEGAAMGDELLSQAYSFRQQEGAIKIDKQSTMVPSYSPMKRL